MIRTTPPLFLAALAALAACSTSASGPVTPTFDGAVEAAHDGRNSAALEALRITLDQDADAVQRALLDPAFAQGLRDEREFRRLLHDAAVRHSVSHLRLVARDEPGEWTTIRFRTVDADGTPVPGATVYVYATDDRGLYHPVLEGERTPRIFGTVVTDESGEAVIETVLPGPYPGTRNPRHIHMDARREPLRLRAPRYAVFDDDPLLFEPQNAEPRGEALRIEVTRGAEGVNGVLVLPLL